VLAVDVLPVGYGLGHAGQLVDITTEEETRSHDGVDGVR
jgi:hypothetical protein